MYPKLFDYHILHRDNYPPWLKDPEHFVQQRMGTKKPKELKMQVLLKQAWLFSGTLLLNEPKSDLFISLSLSGVKLCLNKSVEAKFINLVHPLSEFTCDKIAFLYAFTLALSSSAWYKVIASNVLGTTGEAYSNLP